MKLETTINQQSVTKNFVKLGADKGQVIAIANVYVTPANLTAAGIDPSKPVTLTLTQ